MNKLVCIAFFVGFSFVCIGQETTDVPHEELEQISLHETFNFNDFKQTLVYGTFGTVSLLAILLGLKWTYDFSVRDYEGEYMRDYRIVCKSAGVTPEDSLTPVLQEDCDRRRLAHLWLGRPILLGLSLFLTYINYEKGVVSKTLQPLKKLLN